MSAVTVAAAALDTAITGFQSALTTYINACATANAAYRIGLPHQSNNRLDNSVQHVLGFC